jgi:glycerophosphoryl diester phosphodiesterase
VVVHHDDATGKIFSLPGGEKPVRKASFAEIQAARFNPAGHEADVNRLLGMGGQYQTPAAFRAVTIPELETVLAALPQTRFYVELKTYDHEVRAHDNNDLEARVVRLIREKSLYNRVTVISFSPASLRRVKQLDARIRTGLDFRLPGWAGKHPWLARVFVTYAKRWVRADSLHPAYDDTSAALVDASHRSGLPVVPWVSGQTRDQEQALFPKLIGMGVDGLITNAVDVLNQELKTHETT